MRFREALQRQRDAGIGDVENGSDVALFVPFARDRQADVDLVLMVGDQKLDFLAEHRSAEILDRHADRLDRTRTGEIGVGPGLIVHDADGEGVVGARGLSEGQQRQHAKQSKRAQAHVRLRR